MHRSALEEAIRADHQLKYVNHHWVEEKPKPSYQLKALFSRAYSIQKRQMFTNVFCIGLCPFLMVFISTLLGIIANQQYKHIAVSGKL